MTQTSGVPGEATGEVFSAFITTPPDFYFKPLTDLVSRPAFDALVDKSTWKHGNFTFAFKTATGNMRNHLERLHSKEVIAISLEKGWPIQLSGYKVAQALKNTGAVPFSYEAVLDRLIKFICVNDQSIYVVENKQFRELLGIFRPDYTEDNVPHRTKVRSAIIDAWVGVFSQLKQEIQSAAGRPSFTADICSLACISEPRQEGGLKSQVRESWTAIIAFHHIPGKHTGACLAEVVDELLERARITLGNVFYSRVSKYSLLTGLEGMHAPVPRRICLRVLPVRKPQPTCEGGGGTRAGPKPLQPTRVDGTYLIESPPICSRLQEDTAAVVVWTSWGGDEGWGCASRMASGGMASGGMASGGVTNARAGGVAGWVVAGRNVVTVAVSARGGEDVWWWWGCTMIDGDASDTSVRGRQ
ncbi:hypothetical protein BD779DRAFT_1477678 [Infundibulicybe gibba]|nr:hypothetical protein BD779DRAFT_1477678 [Infundibulicybe gibba]